MSILSIQSHVVYGYVGNKAAVFPLQCMGYDVWPVNTVQFSNPTGYGKWEGEIFSKDHITRVIAGLEAIGVAPQCRAILSGYMGSLESCQTVYETVARFKKRRPSVLYLCDPVIGNTNCFVKPEVLSFFKENLRADIITPNAFEAQTLSGVDIHSLEDLKRAADYFHAKGSALVVVTGVKVPDLPGMHIFLSENGKTATAPVTEYPFATAPSGTGDLLSALFLGHYLKNKNAPAALAYTALMMDAVVKNTYEGAHRELQVTSVRYSWD